MFNPFPHPNAFWHFCSGRLLKTLLQNEKQSILSNFYYCHKVSTLLSTISLLYSFFKENLPYFLKDIFKLISCRFVEGGKGLIRHKMEHVFLYICNPHLQILLFLSNLNTRGPWWFCIAHLRSIVVFEYVGKDVVYAGPSKEHSSKWF